MSIFQTYIGSAYASNPVRWIESPAAARSASDANTATQHPIEKIDPDAGKPRSASGDVLDLSSNVQKFLESGKSESEKSGSKTSDSQDSLQKSSESSGKLGDSTELKNGEKKVADTVFDSSVAENSQRKEQLPSGKELTPEELDQVDKLKARDQEVRVHEMAHMMAGGQHVTGGPSYEYQVGPDGKGYAIGGSVGIDTSPVSGDPEATIAKMQTVAAAALAPAEPSGQDLKVAAAARQAEANARAELAQSKMAQPEDGSEQGSGVDGNAEGGESASVFSIAKPADKAVDKGLIDRRADASAMSDSANRSDQTGSNQSVARSYASGSSEFAPSSAYKAQSMMNFASTRFSAFA